MSKTQEKETKNPLFAVVKTGGKQYIVREGDKIEVEKIKGEVGEKVVLKEVLLKANGEKVEVGVPMVEGSSVETKVVEHGRDEKKITFKYHSKTRYHKKKGHRQPYTKLEILKIS